MPVKYSKSTERLGISIGTIAMVPKPSTWTDSTNITTEGNRWNIINDYPGWLPCDGRTVNVSDYPILYEIIGNIYGGTATTFVLPDYRSKKLVGTGYLNGNIASGLAVTVNDAPGNTAPDISVPGSEGGQYVVNTVRQLPPGSEVTPGSPTGSNTIGGSSSDTFNIGTYRTSGFSSTNTQVEGVITGNATWNAGPVSSRTVPSAPSHDHEVTYIRATGGLGPSDDDGPSCCGRSIGAYPNVVGAGYVNRFDRDGDPIRQHSHVIAWGSAGAASYGTYGDDNTDGGAIYNDVLTQAIPQWSVNYPAGPNRGSNITKTVDVVNDMGMSINPGELVMRDQNALSWDASLNVRLQSAEELSMMTPYFRVKYMIKAY